MKTETLTINQGISQEGAEKIAESGYFDFDDEGNITHARGIGGRYGTDTLIVPVWDFYWLERQLKKQKYRVSSKPVTSNAASLHVWWGI